MAALVFVTSLSACSQREKRELAEDVAASVGRSTGQVFVGQAKMTLRAVSMPGGRPIPPEMSGGTLGLFGVSLDARSGRGAFVGADFEPLVVFDRSTIYAKRVVRSKADKRLWSRLELERLPETDEPTFDDITRGAQPGDAIAVGPVFVADLLSGVLTGSVRERRTDEKGNRHITFNASISKANRELDLDDDEREAREELLRALAIKDDIIAGQVVIGPDGLFQWVRFVFAERPDKQTRLDLEVELSVAPVPAGEVSQVVGLESPDRGTTVRVPAFAMLRSALTSRLQGDNATSPLAGLQALQQQQQATTTTAGGQP